MTSIRLPGTKGPNESEWPPWIQKPFRDFNINERKVNYEFEELHATVIKMWDHHCTKTPPTYCWNKCSLILHHEWSARTSWSSAWNATRFPLSSMTKKIRAHEHEGAKVLHAAVPSPESWSPTVNACTFLFLDWTWKALPGRTRNPSWCGPGPSATWHWHGFSVGLVGIIGSRSTWLLLTQIDEGMRH